MKKLSLEDLVRRLRDKIREPDCNVVWFLGAGCSISSGIPGAGALVTDWLPRLMRYETGSDSGWEKWAAERFPSYDATNPAQAYGAVMAELFLVERDRQVEVERLIGGKDPAVGYALLAQLMANPEFGERANVVLTTNFDDLVADALYLLTPKKPLVVVHDSLAPFVRQSRARPLVVKLHGDALLAPRNTAAETSEIDPNVQERLNGILQGCALVFCGYAGNDRSIAGLIAATPPDAFPFGIYWVGEDAPAGPVGRVLEDRQQVFHVPHRDFDALMLTMAKLFDISLPEEDRFRQLFDTYRKALKERASSDGTAGDLEREAATRLGEEINAWELVRQARTLGETDPDRAQALFENALSAAPSDPGIAGNYAVFLETKFLDDRADEMYRQAIALDETNVINLSNYADFLEKRMKRFDDARTFYRRALASDSSHIRTLKCYADFVYDQDDDKDFAERLYRQALTHSPNDPYVLGSLAYLRQHGHEDLEGAESLYFQAISANSTIPNNLGNYAQLLFARDADSEAQTFALRALAGNDVHPALRLEVNFYLCAHVPSSLPGSLITIRQLLEEGHRSEGWSFSPNIQRVRRENDPRVTFLEQLSDVIADRSPIERLSEFLDWRLARQESEDD